MKRICIICAISLLAGCTWGSTNTNWIAESTSAVMVDENGVLVYPSNLKDTNDLASAAALAAAQAEIDTNLWAYQQYTNTYTPSLRSVSNAVDELEDNVQALSGGSNYVAKTGDSMQGNLSLRGSNLYTNVYTTTFTSDPTAEGWALSGYTWLSNGSSLYIYDGGSTEYARYTNSLQPTGVYRIAWSHTSLSGTAGDRAYTVRYGNDDGTNQVKYVSVLINAGSNTQGSVTFTDAWHTIIIKQAGGAGSTDQSYEINNVQVDERGYDLHVDADIMSADTFDGAWNISSSVPATSTATYASHTIAVSGTNVALCLTNSWLGSGMNWLFLEGAIR